MHASTLVRRSFSHWLARCIAHGDTLALVDSARDVQLDRLLRRSFYAWLARAQHVARARELMQEFLARREMRLASWALARWRDQHRERVLRPVQLELLARRRERIVLDAWQTWTERSVALEAKRLDRAKTTRRAWDRWREMLPLQRLKTRALTHDKLKTQGKSRLVQSELFYFAESDFARLSEQVWQVWVSHWRSRTNKRAAV